MLISNTHFDATSLEQQEACELTCRDDNDDYKKFTMYRTTHHMKSLQWLQKVGCLKNLGIKLWFLTM